MRLKKGNNLNRNLGFTILESIVYTFLTTMILGIGISMLVSMYKSYISTLRFTVKYNNIQNFFINLDSIISEGEIEKITIDDDYVLFTKSNKSYSPDKIIKSNEGKIYVKYIENNSVETIKTVLDDIDNLEIKKKGKLIYFIVHDNDGKEFITCI